MKTVNALTVRQSLGAVLDQLDEKDEPILVEKGRRPRAVLVPIRLFHERFVDLTVHAERMALEKEIESFHRGKGPHGESSEVAIRSLRGKLP